MVMSSFNASKVEKPSAMRSSKWGVDAATSASGRTPSIPIDQKTVDDICIDRTEFDQINLGHGGVIVTAPGNEVDFVSRFFTPQATILEDPVTGSAHCSLVPYWNARTGATEFKAEQRSARRGQLQCTLTGDWVLVRGHALTFSAAQLSSALLTKA